VPGEPRAVLAEQYWRRYYAASPNASTQNCSQQRRAANSKQSVNLDEIVKWKSTLETAD